jgi:hypothetical protein
MILVLTLIVMMVLGWCAYQDRIPPVVDEFEQWLARIFG